MKESKKILEIKEIIKEMHQIHPFPKNYFRSSIPRTMGDHGDDRDQRYVELQKQLMLQMNKCTESERKQLARHIRQLSYGKA